MKAKQSDVVAWALACLRGERVPAPESAATELAHKLGLDALGGSVLALAWAQERSLAVAQAARQASGARGLTIEVAREALNAPVESVLGAVQPLRRYELVDMATVGQPSAV